MTCLQDRIKGALYGIVIGDCLGVPTEFLRRVSPNVPYTGLIYDYDISIKFQWTSTELKAGSPSDDTEMTLTLLRTLLKNNLEYDRESAILAYEEWASQTKMLGRNTRALFKNVKTVKGYENRVRKMDMTVSQSNGSLMRAFPLVFLKEEKDFVDDTSLTNPNTVNLDCTKVYINIMKKILNGEKNISILKNLKKTKKEYCQEVESVIDDALSNKERDVSGKTKGWVCNALYVLLRALLCVNDSSFEAILNSICTVENSDTDTNGSIAGGILGAYLGYESLMKEKYTRENIKRVDEYAFKNKGFYTLHDVDELVNTLTLKFS